MVRRKIIRKFKRGKEQREHRKESKKHEKTGDTAHSEGSSDDEQNCVMSNVGSLTAPVNTPTEALQSLPYLLDQSFGGICNLTDALSKYADIYLRTIAQSSQIDVSEEAVNTSLEILTKRWMLANDSTILNKRRSDELQAEMKALNKQFNKLCLKKHTPKRQKNLSTGKEKEKHQTVLQQTPKKQQVLRQQPPKKPETLPQETPKRQQTLPSQTPKKQEAKPQQIPKKQQTLPICKEKPRVKAPATKTKAQGSQLASNPLEEFRTTLRAVEKYAGKRKPFFAAAKNGLIPIPPLPEQKRVPTVTANPKEGGEAECEFRFFVTLEV
ncbi:hypothetical protein GCK32_015907 [Trichostrongylus colubriformis]|uniref:Uncharacterized protein n=1 Tax=Trichostrongylus colubriformis TaxID=6319 RepID=A0AAN8ILV9_TRICO